MLISVQVHGATPKPEMMVLPPLLPPPTSPQIIHQHLHFLLDLEDPFPFFRQVQPNKLAQLFL